MKLAKNGDKKVFAEQKRSSFKRESFFGAWKLEFLTLSPGQKCNVAASISLLVCYTLIFFTYENAFKKSDYKCGLGIFFAANVLSCAHKAYGCLMLTSYLIIFAVTLGTLVVYAYDFQKQTKYRMNLLFSVDYVLCGFLYFTTNLVANLYPKVFKTYSDGRIFLDYAISTAYIMHGLSSIYILIKNSEKPNDYFRNFNRLGLDKYPITRV